MSKPAHIPGAARPAYEKSAEVISFYEQSFAQPGASKSIPIAFVQSVDGIAKDGQFYITVRSMNSAGLVIDTPVVVTASFLKDAGTKKAKISAPDLLKVGAKVIVKMVEGQLAGKDSVALYRGQQVGMPTKKEYYDLQAVFTAEKEAEWKSNGFFRMKA
jgi:hypothetical protein